MLIKKLFWAQKFFWSKNFGRNNFWVLKDLGPKTFWAKICRGKKNLD